MTDQKVDVEMLRVITAGGPMRVVVTTPAKKSTEEIALMSPAERLDYARSHDQKPFLPDGRRQNDAAMPPWKDPRI
jgi:hypothetical protein